MKAPATLPFDQRASEGLCRRHGVRQLPLFGSVLRGEVDTGRKPSKAGSDEPIRNVLLLDRFRDLVTLPKDDQAVAMELLDALIAARGVETAVARARRTA